MVTRKDIEHRAANLTTEQKTAVNEQLSGMTTEDISKRTVREEVQAPDQPELTIPQEVSQTPQVDPVVWPEPKLFAEPTPQPIQQPEQETKAPEVKEITPSKTPVQNVQEVKNQALVNEADEIAVREQKKQQVNSQFEQMLQSGATTEELAKFATQNSDFSDSFRSSIRSTFKNKANMQFFKKYNGMSKEDMYSAVKNGEIKVGSDRYNMLSEGQRASFEEYKRLKDSPTWIPETKDEVFDGATPENTVDFSNIETFINKMFSSDLRTKLEEARNDDRVVNLSTQLNAKASEIENFDLEGIKENKRLEKELANAGRTPAMIRAALLDNTANRSIARMSMVSEYNRLQWDLTSIKDDIESDLELFKYEDAQAKEKYSMLFSIYESRRAEGIARADKFEDREYEISKMEFLEKNKQIAVQQQQDFQKEILEINQEFERNNQKPQYMTDRNGNLIAVIDGKATTVRNTTGEVVGINRTKDYTDTVEYDSKTGTKIVTRTYEDDSGRLPDTFVSAIDWSTGNNVNMWVQDIIGQIPATWKHPDGGLWCGEFTNLYVKKGGLVSEEWEAIRVWDSYQSKKDIINNPSPQVWGLAVWNPNPEGKYGENGHIGVVTGYNPETGKVEITDYNSKGNWEKATYEVPVSQINNSDWGFVHLKNPNAPITTQETATWDIIWEHSREAVNFGKNIQDGAANIANVPSELRAEVSNYLAENPIILTADNPLVQWLQWQAEIASELLEDEWMAKTVSGRVQKSFTNIFTWGKDQYLAKVQFLLDEQPLQKLISVKEQGGTFGALSEKELALLTKSSSLLNSAANRDEAWNIEWFTMSEDDFIENINTLRNSYLNLIWEKTWTQDIDLEQELTQWAGATLPSGNDIWSYFQ